MKILRIFGIVVGVHALALMLIFVNPGCSSANKPAKSADTARSDENPTNIVTPPEDTAAEAVSPVSAAPAESVAPAEPSGNVGVRFSPTRPGTATANLIETQASVSDVTPATTYTVVSGDSLWTIARRNKLTIAELAAANNIKPNATVRIGQKMIIPAKAVSSSSVNMMEPTKAPATSQPAARRTGESVKHVVRSGETLGGIARKYQVRVGEIATANNIADPAKIRPGMELTIPGWQAPGGPSRANFDAGRCGGNAGSRNSGVKRAGRFGDAAIGGSADFDHSAGRRDGADSGAAGDSRGRAVSRPASGLWRNLDHAHD